ncbi:putative glutamate receptor isoform X2 [Megalopta genalis]|uniref:putative glutamate receptor isoform X2 n=1 Tax=Megalopta genalis TaxID=115081 RepID=UPI0014436BAB|nr:probable glutamate receptor isoform X2 [Megalopta genalis]
MRVTVAHLNLIYLGVRLTMCNPIKPEVYLPLIEHIRSYYVTSAIILVEPGNTDKYLDVFMTKYMAQLWTNKLGRENIASLSITYDKLHSLSRYYNNIVRPIIIVLITGPHTYNEFSNITKTFKMSFPAWFVMFMPFSQDESRTVDHCHEPSGNPFHLTFDTEMVVMCSGDDTLYEWYSIDGRSTEIEKVVKWSPNSSHDFEVLVTPNICIRRNDLKGKVLRGVVVTSSILLEITDTRLRGYIGNIVEELERTLNFTVELVSRNPEFGFYNTTTGRWSGVIGTIVSGAADIGIGDFSMINDRMDYVDFTTPIMTVRQSLYFKQPEMFAVKWSAYYKAFSLAVWGATLLTGFVALIVTTFITRRLCTLTILEVFNKEFLRIWGIMCTQGLTDFPRISSLRLAYISLFLLSIVANSAYSASLICFLTAGMHDVPFRSVNEFINDGTYKIITTRGSVHYDVVHRSSDSLSKAIAKLMKPKEDLPLFTQDAFDQICNDEKLAFLVGFGANMQKKAHKISMPCNVVSIYVGRVESLSMILSKNSQYTNVFNYYLKKLLTSGVLNRNKYDSDFKEETKYLPVTFGSIISVLMIFIFGTGTALLVLAAEMCYNKYICADNSDYRFDQQR